jgi:hypothetical protein
MIEESKESGICRRKICQEFGISKATMSQILKNQKPHLAYDSGIQYQL